jgi:antitoxin component of MazEF toxin-antitoxin module
MTKSIVKIGNSQGIILDAAFMEEARIRVGDEFSVSVHENGTVVLTPLKPYPSREDVSKVINATMRDYARTMKKLA